MVQTIKSSTLFGRSNMSLNSDCKEYDIGTIVEHFILGKGTVTMYECQQPLTYSGGYNVIVEVTFDKYMIPVKYENDRIKDLKIIGKKKKDIPDTGCTCGAKHTSAPQVHMFYCREWKEVKR